LNGGLFLERHRPLPVQKLGLSPLGPLLGLMMSRARLRQSFDEIFGPETKATDEEIDGHWALMREQGGVRIMHKLLRYIPERVEHRDRWVGALQGARAPLKLIDGGVDPVSGAHLYEYYKEQIPNPDAVLLETIGHYPQTEAPAEVVKAFFDFHRKIGTFA
jgi:pimeloyl-ACP methyl ester carboxylesterase